MSEFNSEQPITSQDVFGTPPSQGDSSNRNEPGSQGIQDNRNSVREAAAIAELEKMDKFKYQGKEWTVKDLEKAILRQQDYTKKTQELAKSRETFEQDAKFQKNLAFDLLAVKERPELASEFIKIYPEQYHAYLKEIIGGSRAGQNKTQEQQQQMPQVDVEKEARLQRLEKHFHEQEVSKHSQAINTQMDRLTKKYPDALPELALARVYELMNANAQDPSFQVSDQMWEDAFKGVDSQMQDIFKKRYGDYVKKQTEANKKARDVDSGGGTPGRAPPKFKGFKEVTENAINDLKSRG